LTKPADPVSGKLTMSRQCSIDATASGGKTTTESGVMSGRQRRGTQSAA
jgi:hypothetical protein